MSSKLIVKNHSLKPYSSWQVGGEAEFFALPKTLDEIKDCIYWSKKNNKTLTVLGDGSNVLISDQGVKGLVICLSNFKGIESQNSSDNRFQIIAKAGTSKVDLLRAFMKQKLAPALFLSGLPGQLAGGIVMNAGVSEARVPKEFCEIVDWVEVLKTGPDDDLETKRYQKSEISWSYRGSSGWQPGVIVRAQLSWPNSPDAEIPKKVIAANKLRLSNQPLELPSCGSTFKNPGPISAGQLIEECGLKGYQVGGAKISEKHANFIVNINSAKASDIANIIAHVKLVVKNEKQTDLVTEVKYIGSW